MINNRIQKIREEANLTLDEFAKIIGIARSTLFNYESGKNPIPSNILIKISQTYNVSVDYILGLSPEKYVSLNDFTKDIEKLQQEMAKELLLVDNLYKKVKNNVK